jgi:hypothetical protein
MSLSRWKTFPSMHCDLCMFHDNFTLCLQWVGACMAAGHSENAGLDSATTGS